MRGGGGGGLEADKTEIILSGSLSGTLLPCVKFQVQGRINEIKQERNIKLYVRGIAGRNGDNNLVPFDANTSFSADKTQRKLLLSSAATVFPWSSSSNTLAEGDCFAQDWKNSTDWPLKGIKTAEESQTLVTGRRGSAWSRFVLVATSTELRQQGSVPRTKCWLFNDHNRLKVIALTLR